MATQEVSFFIVSKTISSTFLKVGLPFLRVVLLKKKKLEECSPGLGRRKVGLSSLESVL